MVLIIQKGDNVLISGGASKQRRAERRSGD
jgi:hypothetical protein